MTDTKPARTSRIRASIETIFNVRPDESYLLLLFVSLFFLKGICDVFFATSASTLYLEQFGNLNLPYVYIASALIVIGIGLIYSRSAAAISTSALLKWTLIFVVVSIGSFHLSLLFMKSRWWAMGLMMWREVLYMLLNAAFWAQAGLLFNIRQSKRLFAVIAAGDIASAGLGGFAIPFLVRWMGPLHLLLFAEASIAVCIFVSLLIDREARKIKTATVADFEPDTRPVTQLLREHYLVLFFGLSVLSYVIYFFVDYNFYDVVNTHYPDAATLAGFFGVFYGVLNLFNLVLNSVIAGRLIVRYGIYVGLLAVPLTVFCGTLGAMIFPAFWFIIGTKMMDEMNRGAFLYPTYKILYQPLSARARVRVQAVRDSIVEPGAVGLSGLLLLGLTKIAGFQVPQLSYVLILVLAVFTAVSVLLRKEYVVVLKRALSKRRVIEDASALLNSSSLEVLTNGLNSSNPVEAIYCLNLIEEADRKNLSGVLPNVLRHPVPEVRQHALQVIRKIRQTDILPDVRDLMRTEQSATVLGEAIKTVCSLVEENVVEEVSRHLTDPRPEVQSGTLVGLLLRGETEATVAARRILRNLVVSEIPTHRIRAAQIIGEVQVSDFDQAMLQLLNDENLEVVTAALKAGAAMKGSAVIPAIIERLQEPVLRDVASAALASIDGAVPFLQSAIDTSTTDAEATRYVRILGRIPTTDAVDALLARLSTPNENIRLAILQALARQRFTAKDLTIPRIRKVLDEEISQAVWLLAARQRLEAEHQVDLLRRALANDFEEAKERILLLLSFITDARTFADARIIFQHGSDEQRARAVETIDNLLPKALRGSVVPLLDNSSPSEVLARLHGMFQPRSHKSGHVLESLIMSSEYGLSQWSKACAIYCAAEADFRSLEGAIRRAANDMDTLVRETARGVLANSERKAAAAGVSSN